MGHWVLATLRILYDGEAFPQSGGQIGEELVHSGRRFAAAAEPERCGTVTLSVRHTRFLKQLLLRLDPVMC